MRSTFTKIFLSFWLTEFLIIICTIFILSHQFESNEVVYTSLFAMMQSNAKRSVEAYATGGMWAVVYKTFFAYLLIFYFNRLVIGNRPITAVLPASRRNRRLQKTRHPTPIQTKSFSRSS